MVDAYSTHECACPAFAREPMLRSYETLEFFFLLTMYIYDVYVPEAEIKSEVIKRLRVHMTLKSKAQANTFSYPFSAFKMVHANYELLSFSHDALPTPI